MEEIVTKSNPIPSTNQKRRNQQTPWVEKPTKPSNILFFSHSSLISCSTSSKIRLLLSNHSYQVIAYASTFQSPLSTSRQLNTWILVGTEAFNIKWQNLKGDEDWLLKNLKKDIYENKPDPSNSHTHHSEMSSHNLTSSKQDNKSTTSPISLSEGNKVITDKFEHVTEKLQITLSFSFVFLFLLPFFIQSNTLQKHDYFRREKPSVGSDSGDSFPFYDYRKRIHNERMPLKTAEP